MLAADTVALSQAKLLQTLADNAASSASPAVTQLS
jgi:hypothetical protein